jgi:uncharacterized protein
MTGRAAGGDPPRTAIVLRPLANPLPLGFLGLAAATLLVSALQLGWLDPELDGQAVALILIAFVFPLQLLTSIFGYLTRDVVAGTGMGILAGTWLSIALVTLTSPAGSTSDGLGAFLLIAAVAMWVPASTAAASKVVPALVLATAGLRFAVTGAYQLSAAGSWQHIAGWVGLVLCALGVYAALAMELEDARGSEVLPLGRRSAIEGEAGVRRQL